MSRAIVAEELVKVYDNGVLALDGVSIEIPSGVVFSLLGRNGAGKTTFVKISSTQLLPTSGRVSVFGYDAVSEADKVRRLIAVVPQEGRPALLNTPYEHVLHYLLVRGFPVFEARRRTGEVLRMLELDEYSNTLCSKLSGGLRQRTLVAMVLASDADLLFLDEPTLGLDAIARVKIWDLIRTITRENDQTVLLTTHYMEEAEAISEKVAIISRGRIACVGSIEEVKGILRGKVCIELHGVKNLRTDALEVFGEYVIVGDTVRLYSDESSKREVFEYAVRTCNRVLVREITLEDIFMMVSGGGSDVGGGHA